MAGATELEPGNLPLLGLIANEYYIRNFDRWLLLLILGTFTGAYPLMYFAQEFILLNYPILSPRPSYWRSLPSDR